MNDPLNQHDDRVLARGSFIFSASMLSKRPLVELRFGQGLVSTERAILTDHEGLRVLQAEPSAGAQVQSSLCEFHRAHSFLLLGDL